MFSSNSSSKYPTKLTRTLLIATTLLAFSAVGWYVVACPFCSAINLTFAEQIKSNDIVVIAKLMEIPEAVDDPDVEIPKSIFEVTEVVKGNESVRAGMTFRSLLVGRYPLGENFLVMGVDPPRVAWSTPMRASDRVVKYLQSLNDLPESGPKRLEFFQNYFEDEESVLAFDAYDEFAAAPFEDIVAIKDKLNREQILTWIKNTETVTNRRRLYFVLLSVCGQKEDVELLETFIKSGDRKKQAGLDSLISCYLTLNGEAGLPLVVDTFLKDKEIEYVDTLAAVTALRFHGTEVKYVPRQKIVGAIRTLLDRPNIADMVIPDLANWEDWSVMERLVQMFKDADEDTSWVRVPIASYLRACPKPEAKHHIAELQKIDPDSVKRADFFLMLDGDEEEEKEDGEPVATSDQPEEKSTLNVEMEFEPPTNGQQPNPIESEKQHLEIEPKSDTNSSKLSGSGSSKPILEKAYVAQRIPLDQPGVKTSANVMNSSAATNVKKNDDIAQVSASSSGTAINSQRVDIAAQTAPELTSNVDIVADSNGVGAEIVASADIINVPTWQLIVIPFACSAFVFVLLWSVISGWFDRLIF